MANLQVLFDRIVNHLAVQKVQAKEGLTCKYRTASGLSCAVGCLIPDDKYDPEFDIALSDIDVYTVIEKTGILAGYNREDFEDAFALLDSMQLEHDSFITNRSSYDNAAILRRSLRYQAARFGLNAHAVKNITEWMPPTDVE